MEDGKLFLLGASAGLLTFLQGCVLPPDIPRSLSPVTVQEIRAKYGPTDAHWIGAPQRIDMILLLGPIRDPKANNGRLIPMAPSGALDSRWFTLAGLDHVEVYDQPTRKMDQPWNFGPKFGEAEGIYQYERHPAGTSGCEEYDKSMILAAKLLSNKDHSFQPLIPKGECLTYHFSGPLQVNTETYLLYYYVDSDATKRGSGVMVTELRKGENIVARSVHCFSAYGLDDVPQCNSSSNSYEIENLLSTGTR